MYQMPESFVWVLAETDYDHFQILGIYSSEAVAEEEKQHCEEDNPDHMDFMVFKEPVLDSIEQSVGWDLYVGFLYNNEEVDEDAVYRSEVLTKHLAHPVQWDGKILWFSKDFLVAIHDKENNKYFINNELEE